MTIMPDSYVPRWASSPPLGERHSRRAVHEFIAHYRLERNHQGLMNALINSVTGPPGRRDSPAIASGRIAELLRARGLCFGSADNVDITVCDIVAPRSLIEVVSSADLVRRAKVFPS